MTHVNVQTVATTTVLSLLMLMSAGCAQLPPVAEAPAAYRLEAVGRVVPGTSFAWHPRGDAYAAADRGLVVAATGGNDKRIDRRIPSSIAWSPTGSSLAAAFRKGDRDTAIEIFGWPDGLPAAGIKVPGQVRDLSWRSDDELLFVAVQLDTYSFGGAYRAVLYRWRRDAEPIGEPIAETTPMKPVVDALGDAIFDTVHLRLSPWRDEILFTRFVAPPNAPSHCLLVTRHLETGRERTIARLPLDARGGRYVGDGDTLLYSDGRVHSVKVAIWGDVLDESIDPGLHLEISPGGRFLLVDETLLRDRTPVTQFTGIDSAAFSPDGSRLLVSSGRRLFLLSGLDDGPVPRFAAGERRLQLRRWRSEELISPAEFDHLIDRIGSE